MAISNPIPLRLSLSYSCTVLTMIIFSLFILLSIYVSLSLLSFSLALTLSGYLSLAWHYVYMVLPGFSMKLILWTLSCCPLHPLPLSFSSSFFFLCFVFIFPLHSVIVNEFILQILPLFLIVFISICYFKLFFLLYVIDCDFNHCYYIWSR